jgi:hypothetical protein
MSLDNLVAISGKPGLFKMISNRSNGLIVEEFDSNKRYFVSARLHQFTPLASISIYTDNEEETVLLKDVFKRMLEQSGENPTVDLKSNSDLIRSYFTKIMPEHDQERVQISDIKKLIKWYSFLESKDLLNFDDITEEISE